MAHEPKLELYKLRLFHKNDGSTASFRDVFRTRLVGKNPQTLDDFFRAYHEDFANQINLKTYTVNNKKKKAFTLAKGEDDKLLISSPVDTNWIISGILKGGIHGRERELGVITDTNNNRRIDKPNLVADRYYFLIYTPIDHSEAILMIQSYGAETKISDIVRDHFKSYFSSTPGIKCEVELFVPKSIIKEYLDEAMVSSIDFSTGWAVRPGTFGELAPRGYEFEVKISIKDKSQYKSSYKVAKHLRDILSKSIFRLDGSSERKLSEFETKKAKISKNNTEKTYMFDNENDLKVVVNLIDHGIEVSSGGVPNFT